jgi:hypothetical protein
MCGHSSSKGGFGGHQNLTDAFFKDHGVFIINTETGRSMLTAQFIMELTGHIQWSEKGGTEDRQKRHIAKVV